MAFCPKCKGKISLYTKQCDSCGYIIGQSTTNNATNGCNICSSRRYKNIHIDDKDIDICYKCYIDQTARRFTDSSGNSTDSPEKYNVYSIEHKRFNRSLYALQEARFYGDDLNIIMKKYEYAYARLLGVDYRGYDEISELASWWEGIN